MQGTVRPYDTADGTRWRFVVDLGQQQCRRCTVCDTRSWDHADTMCPKRKCRGRLGEPRVERRQTSKRGFTKKGKAQAKLREVLGDVESNTYVPPSRQTLRQYLEAWHAGLALRATTLATYGRNIAIASRHLGHVPLAQLTPEQVDAMYRTLERSGGKRGQPLAPKSVRSVHVTLRKALQDALERGHVGRNVAALAKPPSTKSHQARACWDETQLRRFLEHVADDRLSALWRLMASTGMRRSEAVGLCWRDLDSSRLTIGRQTVTTADGVMIRQDGGKSAAAERTITLDAATVAALRAHKVAQLEERLHAGPAWSQDPADADRMFVYSDGRGMRPDYLSRLLGQHARRAGLPATGGPHVLLRHTYATVALRNGVPVEVVSKRLGHANIGITLQTYRHVTAVDDERAAEVTARFLDG